MEIVRAASTLLKEDLTSQQSIQITCFHFFLAIRGILPEVIRLVCNQEITYRIFMSISRFLEEFLGLGTKELQPQTYNNPHVYQTPSQDQNQQASTTPFHLSEYSTTSNPDEESNYAQETSDFKAAAELGT